MNSVSAVGGHERERVLPNRPAGGLESAHLQRIGLAAEELRVGLASIRSHVSRRATDGGQGDDQRQLLSRLDQADALVEAIARAAREDDGVPSVTEDLTAEHAAHWARLYEDLAALEGDLLERASAQNGSNGEDGAADLQLLEGSIRRLENRGRYWREVAWSQMGVARDDATRTLRFRDREIRLTRREYSLVATLMDERGRKFPAPQLVQRAWGTRALSTEQLRTYIARLRNRCATAGIPLQIVTDRGRGYSLDWLPPTESDNGTEFRGEGL